MDIGAQKLRALARQSRTLSLVVKDMQRARALESLARLYDEQAAEIEAPQPA
jgi:hypothetical protein